MGLWIRKTRFVRTIVDIPMAIFLLGSLLALASSSDFHHSLRVIVSGTMVPILCFYLIVNSLRTRQDLIVVAAALLFSFLMMSGYSLITFKRDISFEVALGGVELLTQFFFNPPDPRASGGNE